MLALSIKEQLPKHIQEDHPLFVSFVEYYYEWLESSGMSYDVIANHSKNLNIGENFVDYVGYLRKEYISQFPKETNVDDKRLISHIKEFYLSKGTVKSMKFVMNLLFGESITVYFPKVDLFKVSDLENSYLSHTKKLQDSDYYQDYSYEISSSLAGSQYEDILNKLVHPAGFKLFTKLV